MTVTYKREKVDDFIADATELLTLHFDEITVFKDLMQYCNPDLDTYRILEQRNEYHIIAARDDGKLIGYFTGYVRPHAHYKHVLVGSDDIYFVHKDYRKGMIGWRMAKMMMEIFKECGCKTMVCRTKMEPATDAIWERMGMMQFERSYIRRLD